MPKTVMYCRCDECLFSEDNNNNKIERQRKNARSVAERRGEKRRWSELIRIEQSRAEQSRAEQSRAEQSRTEQNRTEQNRKEQNKAEQRREEKRRVERSRDGLI